jgi:hypothetical protein
MRASRRGSYVYTERGAGAEIKAAPRPFIVKLDDETTVSSPAAPTRKIEPKPELVCPHSGIFIGGTLICVECLCERIPDKAQRAEEEQRLFGVAVLAICKQAAFKNKLASIPVEDCLMTAALELIRPQNQKKILAAETKNPGGLAYTIATRAIQKLYRRKSVADLSVGQMNFGSGDEDFSVSSRLDYLHGIRRFGTNQDIGGTPDSSTGVASDSVLVSEEQIEWAACCYQRVRVFPGIKLLWTDENLKRLRVVLDEAKAILPTKPFSVWLIIDMKIGFSQGMTQYTWEEIAKQVSSSWKPVTERQVRYAYDQGLAAMKAHLISKLLPVSGVVNS